MMIIRHVMAGAAVGTVLLPSEDSHSYCKCLIVKRCSSNMVSTFLFAYHTSLIALLSHSHPPTKKSKLTQSQGLEGNACTGCMGSCCCACCELMQTSKELDYILLEKNAGAKGYQPQPGMVADPQTGAFN